MTCFLVCWELKRRLVSNATQIYQFSILYFIRNLTSISKDSDTGKLPSSTEKQSPVLVADAVHTNKGIENRLTSPDPLSIGLFAEDSLTDAMIPQTIVEAPTTTPDSQPEATEDVPKPPNDRKHSSLPCLTSRLAEVIHCNSRDDVSILQKVKNCITEKIILFSLFV